MTAINISNPVPHIPQNRVAIIHPFGMDLLGVE